MHRLPPKMTWTFGLKLPKLAKIAKFRPFPPGGYGVKCDKICANIFVMSQIIGKIPPSSIVNKSGFMGRSKLSIEAQRTMRRGRKH